jgi:hypothetical protein
MRHDIILIGPIPSPELKQSLRILDERTGYTAVMGFNINRHFLTHHSNQELATITVYTGGHTPEQTCGEILRITGTHGTAGAELDSPV